MSTPVHHAVPASQKTPHPLKGHILPPQHSQHVIRERAMSPIGWCRQAPRAVDRKRQSDFYQLWHSRRFCRRQNYPPEPAGLLVFAQNQRRVTRMPPQIRPNLQSPRHQKPPVTPTGQRQWPGYHQAIGSAPPLICWPHQRPQQIDRVCGQWVKTHPTNVANARRQPDRR